MSTRLSSSNSNEQAVPILLSNQECICTIQYLHPSRTGHQNICPEHFLLLIFQKACIPEPTGKPTCIVLYRGSISPSFSFSFYHSIITIWHHFHHIITEHGALLTGHGSWMALSVKCSTSSATPPNVPIPTSCSCVTFPPKVRGYDRVTIYAPRDGMQHESLPPRWMDSIIRQILRRVVRYYLLSTTCRRI